jgi:phosphate starvation-inducible membrane PsiE
VYPAIHFAKFYAYLTYISHTAKVRLIIKHSLYNIVIYNYAVLLLLQAYVSGYYKKQYISVRFCFVNRSLTAGCF